MHERCLMTLHLCFRAVLRVMQLENFLYRVLSLTCLSAALLGFGSGVARAANEQPGAATVITQSVPEQGAPSPFMRQRNAVVQAAQNRQWERAIAHAKQLLEMTLPDGNPYEQLDASELLNMLQHQQGLYAENVQLADRMLAAAMRLEWGPISGQVQSLAQRGLMAAMMLQDSAGVARYQQMLLKEAPLFPAQWQWDGAAQRLTFHTAQLSVPTVLGRWVLMEVEAAQDRNDISQLRYMYAKHNGQRMFATMRLNYEDAFSELPLVQREQRLAEHLDIYSGGEDSQSSKLSQPELAIAGAQQQRKVVRVSSASRPDTLQMHWAALRGNWSWHMEMEMLQADHASGSQAIETLWQSMQWPQAPDLPNIDGQPVLPWRESEITAAWRSSKDWSKSGQLARAAMPDARFPSEVARLNTVAGIAAFKAGQHADAEKYLQAALQAWPYAKVFDSTLIDNAQQYGAAMALRRGDTAAAAALLRQYLRNAGGLENVLALSEDKQQAWIDNRRTGMGLPMQAAGLYMQEPDGWQRIQYRDLRSEYTLGLTSGMRIPADDDEQEALLRKALEQQFKLKAGTLRKHRFVAKLAKAGQPPRHGQYWVFDVTALERAENGAPKNEGAPARQALFWLVDQGEQRAILRASVANNQQVQQAWQLAEALRW